MSDTTLQISVTVNNNTAIASLSQLSSAFKSTTTAVAGMWAEAGTTITIAMKNFSAAAEDASGRTKEQIEKASGAVEKLGDLIGVKVPGDLTKMLAASETIGPVLEAAFTPLKIVAMIQFAVELADKIKTVAENLGGWTKEAKENYEALVRGNRQIVEFNEKLTDSARRLNEIGHSGSALTKIQIENEKAHRAEIEKKIIAYGNEAAALHRLLEGTHAEKVADEYGQEIEIQVANSANLSGEEIDKFRKRLGELEGDAQHAKGAVREFWEQVQQSKQITETGQKRELAAQQVQEYIASQQVRLSADKDLAEKRIALEQSVARNQLLTGKITAEQAAAAETKALDDRYNVQTQYLTKLRNLLAKDPEHNKDRLVEIKEQLKAAEVDHQKAVLDLYNHTLEQKAELEKAFTASLQEESRRQAENAAKEVEKAFEKIHKMVEEIKAAQDILANSAKKHEDALNSLALSRLDFERQIGKLSESEYEKRLAAELAAEYRKAREKLLLDRQAANGKRVEQARIDAELLRLDDKYRADTEKAEQKSYLRRRQQFDQYFKQISSSFTSEINSWIQGTETVSQAFSKMFQSMIMALVDYLEQKAMKRLEDWLIDKLFNVKSATSATSAASGIASAMGFASVMAALPFPANVSTAPIVAAAAGAQAAALGTAGIVGAASSAGGDWRVDRDRLNLVHANETILPAGIAGKLRDMVEGGGSRGLTVVVNHSVNAVDAESFQGHIRKHGNMIGNEVARVLKRKGLASR